MTVHYAERKKKPVILIHPDNGKVSRLELGTDVGN